jgi:hypothetical protein
MQPPYLWDFPDRAIPWSLDGPWNRTIHVQRLVSAPAMIIVEVFGQEPPQMSLMQDDHVVQTFTTDAPDEAFDIWVLPGTSRSNDHFFHIHVSYTLPKGDTIDAITIA